jgi:2,4-dienoyl-CoA reductase-like NADH-dependent reductase (Old Yellow Enzyme family)/thioredoxin reductase
MRYTLAIREIQSNPNRTVSRRSLAVMETLFSPFRIKTLQLKNRIVMPSVASFLIGEGGSITDAAVEHYRRRAAGGPAMVIMEACAVSPEGIVSPNQARIDSDGLIDGLARIARVMKLQGAIAAIQLHHGGRQTSAKVIGRKPLAPSPIPCPTIRGDVEPLSIEGIRTIIRQFGEAAVRACQAGFELIEIHGAHGYLVNQFLSPISNVREDQYGGSLAGRARFAAELVAELRSRVGPEVPLSFKISAEEYVPGGLTVVDSIKILEILVEAGIDVVQVSAGCDVTPEWICQPAFMGKACLAETAEKVKKALTVPVMAVGRINDPFIANHVLETGKADLVCIGRGLLADPEMPIKAQQGRFSEIRTCIACNTCMESIFRRGRIECLVNPTLGRETEMEIHPAEKKRKIMVVGGGPGGLNFAWVAAKRGHEVHLFEKRSSLGGQLLPGSMPGHKKELRTLVNFQRGQIEKFGVQSHLGHEVTPKDIESFKPDVVILATGSLPAMPVVEGIDKDIVMTYEDILRDSQPTAKKIVVVGGGATGCEIALHLAEYGCSVTLVEMLPKIGTGLETMTKKILRQKLNENKVRIMTDTRLTRVEDNGAILTDQDNQDIFLEAEKIVIAIGTRPDNRLYERIKAMGYEIHQIGDCLEPRSAKAAIYDSAVLGRAV